jgi:hypothetical protein
MTGARLPQFAKLNTWAADKVATLSAPKLNKTMKISNLNLPSVQTESNAVCWRNIQL